MTAVRVAVVYHSAYRGSTAALAAAVARGAARVEDAEVLQVPVEQVDEHWDDLHAADALVLGSPTYVGSISAAFKAFIERLAGDVWRERMWLSKLAGGFTVGSGPSGDQLNTLQNLAIFAAQMGMIWVPVRQTGGHYASTTSYVDATNRIGGYLGVMAQAQIDERPPQAPPASDLRTAELHGEHIATVARQLACGRARHPSPYPDRRTRPGRPATLWDRPLTK